ncbi:MAG: hypothetical protein JWL81_283, partial [Verrucomicrobiales bacterium]|nr:hypothetical protein [Verrucomicrobiales bacterium]
MFSTLRRAFVALTLFAGLPA